MSDGQVRIVGIQKLYHQRADEQRQLQDLNDDFGRYIRRVQDLENKNRQLRSQIDVLKQNWGFDSIKVKDAFSKDLVSVRKQLDDTEYKVTLAKVQVVCAEYDKSSLEHQINFTNAFAILNQNQVSSYKQEYERSKADLNVLDNQVKNKKQEIEEGKNEMKQQLDRVQVLNKELQKGMMARVAIEIELQTYREELLFMKAIYGEEYGEFLALGSFQIDVGQFYQTELTRAIADIRKDYELLAQIQHQEWQAYYKIKTEQTEITMIEENRKKEGASRSGDVGMMDMKVLHSELSESRKSYTTFQAEYLELSKRLTELEDNLQIIRSGRNPKLIELNQELAVLKAQYNEYQAATSSIHENNVSLLFEINTYRRLLQGSLTVTETKTRAITIVWTNSSTANFSANDFKTSSVLQWEENIKISTKTERLTTTCNGPEGWTNVSFSADYDTTKEIITIEATVKDQFNFSNYGRYQLTIYYPNSKTAICSFVVHLEPRDDICMPKQYIIRDTLNIAQPKTTVQLQLKGKVVFIGTSDSQGIVDLPQTLSNNCYDVEINTNNDRYKVARFQRIVFNNKGAQSQTYYIYRQLEENEVEFVLIWGERPSDLDSHIFVSDNKRHVYFSNKHETNLYLDLDCRKGSGPETIRVKLEPNMKYVYAVHRYTKDGELPNSNAIVMINANEPFSSGSPSTVRRVPYVDQPEANYWIVCQIDGTTKKFTFFKNAFENEDDCATDHVVRKYYNP